MRIFHESHGMDQIQQLSDYIDQSKSIVVQINPGHTGFDQVAVLNIREESDDVFRKLKERQEKNG